MADRKENLTVSVQIRLTQGGSERLDDLVRWERKKHGKECDRAKLIRSLIDNAHMRRAAKIMVKEPLFKVRSRKKRNQDGGARNGSES